MVSWMMAIKSVLISSGVASVGLLLKLSVPVAVDFSVSRAPVMWSCLLSWLKPPYLYIVTNGIIITIVASSKYYQSTCQHDREDDEIDYCGDYKIIHTESIVHQAPLRMLEVKDLDSDAHFGVMVATPPSPQLELDAVTAVVYDDEHGKMTDAVAMMEDEIEVEEEVKSVIVTENSDLVESGGDDEVILPPISNRNHLPPMMTESENLPPTEKPLVSSRFGHRKTLKANPEGGRTARVTKPNDTMDVDF